MKHIYLAIWAAFFSLGMATVSAAATYNLEDDFSATTNPNGAWSYGGYGSANDASSFFIFGTSITDAYGGVGLNGWDGGLDAYRILQNQTASDLSPGTPIYPAGSVTVHPAFSGQQAVVRWTAQTDGAHDVGGLFYAVDPDGSTTTTDAQIFLNGVNNFSGNVSGALMQNASFNLALNLLAGDTLDFVVGFGSDRTYTYDTTGIQAVISGPDMSAIPLPASVMLLFGALMGLVGLRRRA